MIRTVLTIVFVLLKLLTTPNIDGAPLRELEKTKLCSELPTIVLESILGGAYNPRYMSVSRPIEENSSPGNKRTATFGEDFYVDENFQEEVDPEPAWKVVNHVTISKMKYGLVRNKRGLDYMQEWNCMSKIVWTDLGPEYFPRYLQSVSCISTNCWFGLYRCKPRSFTVKLLRRKKGFCRSGSDAADRVGFAGLPEDLRELWVWEEKAVNFCCACTRM